MGRPTTPLIVVTFGLLCLIWGTTWRVIQVGLQGIPPFSGIALRFAIAAALMLALILARGIELGRKPMEVRLWVINALLGFCISYGVVYWGEQWVPSGLAAILFATYPLFVSLLAHFALPAEPLTRKEIVGIVIGFAGVGVIFSEDFAALGGREVAIAAAIMLFSPIAAAGATVSVKRWGSRIHPFSISGVPMAITAGVMGGLAVALERERTFTWNTVSVSALLYLAVFGSAVTFSLYYWLLTHLPAKRLALVAYVVPVVAVIVGALCGEPLTRRMLAGSALVVTGVILAVQQFGPHGLRRNPAQSSN